MKDKYFPPVELTRVMLLVRFANPVKQLGSGKQGSLCEQSRLGLAPQTRVGSAD